MSLEWKATFDKFDRLIKWASKQVILTTNPKIVDKSLDAQDLYQEGTALLWKCWNKYNDKDEDSFKKLFSVSLFRCLRTKVVKYEPVISINLSENEDTLVDSIYSESDFEEIFMEYGIQQLRSLLEDDYVSLLIIDELLEPSERTFWEMTMDMNRKATLKLQGKHLNVPNAHLKNVHIRRALELNTQDFLDAMNRIREKASLVFYSEPLFMEL